MIKENRFIYLKDGTKIHTQIKEVAGPIWVVVTHGLGEHLERHNYMLGLFNNNFNIFQYDLRGHGRSEGRRAYVENFENYIQDLGEILEYLQETFRAEKIVLFGHSMGGLITAGYLQNLAAKKVYPQCVFLSALCFSAPGLLGNGLKLFPKLTHSLAQIPMSIPLGRMINLHRLSHDSMVYENYVRDELNSLKIHSHLFFELLRYANFFMQGHLGASCPVKCVVGGEDKIISVESIRYYFQEIETQAQLEVVEGAYHEMHNEIKKFRDPYFEALTNFIYRHFYPNE